jgi:hypothetical protein
MGIAQLPSAALESGRTAGRASLVAGSPRRDSRCVCPTPVGWHSPGIPRLCPALPAPRERHVPGILKETLGFPAAPNLEEGDR